MGSQQSSREDDGAAIPKTCYYELLGIDRLASDVDIKKAYRKRALDLHPDRNLDNVATATQKFAEVQSAYEVLSDPHERAWYDSHREAILSGQDNGDDGFRPTTFNNVRLTSTEEVVGLMRKFNAAILFNDEPTGFFGLARETFDHLSLEEEAATEGDGTACPKYPTFGSSSDSYDSTVKPFYSTWAGFATSKTFSWKDKYRLSDAPDRRTRRLMEKENKKCRDDAIREFNDAVKFLVIFIRKRDPRYIPNFQTDADRQSSLRVASAAQAARSRAVNQQRLGSSNLPDWSRSRDGETEQDLFPELDEDHIVEIFECIVCNKTFKSEKQLEVHERSKKHTKTVQLLRRQMQKEGTDLDLDSEIMSSETDDRSGRATAERVDSLSHGRNSDLHETEKLGGDWLYASQLSEARTTPESSVEPVATSDSAAREIVLERLAGDPNDSISLARPLPAPAEDELSKSARMMSLGNSGSPGKVGKAKMKKQKRIAKQDEGEEHRCSACGELFSSRTKLFHHIREAGHAAPLSINEQKHTKAKR